MRTKLHLLTGFIALLIAADAHAMRWYTSSSGRWLSRDPIGLHGGISDYPIARNDAVNHIDAKGLKCCECVKDIHIDNVEAYIADPIIGEHVYGHRFKVWITLERKGCGKLYPATMNWWENSNVQSVLHPEFPPNTWNNYTTTIGPGGPNIDSFPTWLNRRKTCPDTETVVLSDIPGQWFGSSRTLHFLVQVLGANECTCRPLQLQSVSAVQTLTSPEPGPPPIITRQDFATPDPSPPP